MKYFLRNPDDQAITGPFELDDIEAKLQAGELSADTLATGDIGESRAQLRSAPAEDWMSVRSIPGFGQERPLESVPLAAAAAPPLTPPPLPQVKLHPTGERKPGGLLAGLGTALGAVLLFLLTAMSGLVLFGFLLLVLFGSKCRA